MTMCWVSYVYRYSLYKQISNHSGISDTSRAPNVSPMTLADSDRSEYCQCCKFPTPFRGSSSSVVASRSLAVPGSLQGRFLIVQVPTIMACGGRVNAHHQLQEDHLVHSPPLWPQTATAGAADDELANVAVTDSSVSRRGHTLLDC